MERLGLGPELLLADNPRLVYGRMTGWGQEGPLAGAAGHDINYIALSGALHTIGRDGRPSPPVNYVGDFGGGGMLLAFAMVSALLGGRGGAPGQVIDCAMTDGSALLASLTWGLYARRPVARTRPAPTSSTAAPPYYDTYETADGKWIAVGAIEPQFRAELCEKLGISGAEAENRDALAALFRRHPRDHWCALLEGTDACFAPVLSLAEAPAHPHNAFRDTFANIGGVIQPAPAPRYSATKTDVAVTAARRCRRPARRARLRSGANRRAPPRRESSAEPLGVPAQMVRHEGRDEIIAVVVARLDAQSQRDAGFEAYALQQLRLAAARRETDPRRPTSTSRSGTALRPRSEAYRIVPAPRLLVITEIARRSAFSPPRHLRWRDDRREGGDGLR